MICVSKSVKKEKQTKGKILSFKHKILLAEIVIPGILAECQA